MTVSTPWASKLVMNSMLTQTMFPTLWVILKSGSKETYCWINIWIKSQYDKYMSIHFYHWLMSAGFKILHTLQNTSVLCAVTGKNQA